MSEDVFGWVDGPLYCLLLTVGTDPGPALSRKATLGDIIKALEAKGYKVVRSSREAGAHLGELQMALQNGVTHRQFYRAVRPKLRWLIEAVRIVDEITKTENDLHGFQKFVDAVTRARKFSRGEW